MLVVVGDTLKTSGSLRDGETLRATQRPLNPDRQLALVPENGMNGMVATNALAIVSVNDAKKEQALVFPAFNGRSVQHFGKEVEGETQEHDHKSTVGTCAETALAS